MTQSAEIEHERLRREVFEWVPVLATEGEFGPGREFWSGWGWAKVLGAGFLLVWGGGLLILGLGFLADWTTDAIERRRRRRDYE